jgi:tRNA(Arg) A34 adenosine deaminase TadA
MPDSSETRLSQLNARFKELQATSPAPDDRYVIETLREALTAAAEGNYGVGAVIVDRDGDIVAAGHNKVFNPYFRSDQHAEMVAASLFEDVHPDVDDMQGFRLYSSLESCPMCWTRLIIAGFGGVYYAAADTEGAMTGQPARLPDAWCALIVNQRFGPANCNAELRTLALDIFLETVHLNQRLLARRGAGSAKGTETPWPKSS